jgi:mycothiol synthase
LISYLTSLNEDQQSGVLKLISIATDFDGAPPIAEHIVLHLRHGGDKDDRHLILEVESEIVGYAHIDLTDTVAGSSAELVIHPDFRNHGYGQALLAEIVRITSPRLWAHGDLPSARKLALENGFQKIRTVLQMRRPLTQPLPLAPSGIEIRTFLPSLDEAGWLQLNNRIFQSHPEQSDWSMQDLQHRMKEEWFDPSGFLLATRGEELIAYCWTKIHGAHVHSHDGNDDHGHDLIGEIYAMGVDPSIRGEGLGRALTIAGLSHLRTKSLMSAMLYVDEENDAATSLYKSLGFVEWSRDVMYGKKIL